MAFFETRMPDCVSYGTSGGAMWSTDVITLDGGHEKRNANWSQRRGRWSINQSGLNRTELDTLLALFHLVQGRAHGFRFKDWSDFSATNQNIGTGTGALATFQLRKTYTIDASSHHRTITKPVSGTVQIYVNGVLKTETTHYTINYTTGVVTFTGGNLPANGHAVVANFQFDVPVRFDVDEMNVTLDSATTYTWSDGVILELKA